MLWAPWEELYLTPIHSREVGREILGRILYRGCILGIAVLKDQKWMVWRFGCKKCALIYGIMCLGGSWWSSFENVAWLSSSSPHFWRCILAAEPYCYMNDPRYGHWLGNFLLILSGWAESFLVPSCQLPNNLNIQLQVHVYICLVYSYNFLHLATINCLCILTMDQLGLLLLLIHE